jgi:HTH-type transcriptional regulator/antitoxin HigA
MEETMTIKAPSRKWALQARYGVKAGRYLELVNRFPLVPIANESELDSAIAVIDELLDQGQRNTAEEAYLDVLGTLVEAYESVHYPEPDVSDAAMLQSLMESRNLTQSAIAKGAGIALSTISEVLSGKRQLTRSQIGKISRFFKVDPGVFSFDR